MRFRLRALTFLIALFVVTGCVTRNISNVTTFSNLPANYVGSTIAVVASPPEKNESLAWLSSYRTIFENELRKKGFRVTNAKASDYIAIVAYGIGADTLLMFPIAGENKMMAYDGPVYGQTARAVTVKIEDRRTKKKVFEGILQSNGSCNNLSAILPYLASAMFQKFPQPYAGTVTVPNEDGFVC